MSAGTPTQAAALAVARIGLERIAVGCADTAEACVYAEKALHASEQPDPIGTMLEHGMITLRDAQSLREELAAPAPSPDLAAAMAERDEAREQLAAADRATAEFRRQCSELAGELGAARAVVREMDAHIASGDDYADPAKRAGWRQRAGIGAGQ